MMVEEITLVQDARKPLVKVAALTIIPIPIMRVERIMLVQPAAKHLMQLIP